MDKHSHEANSRSGISCEMKSSLLWDAAALTAADQASGNLQREGLTTSWQRFSVQGEWRVSGSCCLWEQSHSSSFVSVCYTFSIALVTWALLSGRGKAAITQAFHWAVTQTVTGVEMACVPLWQQVNKVMVQQATRTQNCRLSHRALAVHACFLFVVWDFFLLVAGATFRIWFTVRPGRPHEQEKKQLQITRQSLNRHIITLVISFSINVFLFLRAACSM